MVTQQNMLHMAFMVETIVEFIENRIQTSKSKTNRNMVNALHSAMKQRKRLQDNTVIKSN